MGYREERAAGRQRSGGAPVGGTDMSYLGPDVLDYVEGMAGIGYDAAVAMEILEYQAKRDDADREYKYWAAEKNAQSAENAARIAADGYAQAAATGAEADRYAADQALRAAQERAAASRYAADQALEAVRVQEANRLKIAAAELKLESQRVAAEELGAPSDWRKQAGFLRGMGMTQESITPQAIRTQGEALGPVEPEMYQAAPQQAVVGEAGPELATATPQGVQVEPIQRETAWWLRKQGTPGMQFGGTVRTSGSFMPSRQVSYSQLGGTRGYTPKSTLIGSGGIPYTSGGGYTAGMGSHGSFTTKPISAARPIQTSNATTRIGQPVGPGQPLEEDTTIRIGQPVRTDELGGIDQLLEPIETHEAGEPVSSELTGEVPYLEMLRSGAYVPLWQAWGGPRTKPEVGMNIPIKMPHEINYGNFLRLTPTEQQMAFADWEALGMPPDTAFRIMQASAMRGTARAATAYG